MVREARSDWLSICDEMGVLVDVVVLVDVLDCVDVAVSITP